jgi:hypothetical protein
MKRRTIVFGLLICSAACGLAHACPMCKDSIASPGEANAAQSGLLPYAFNTSIYTMLLGFFATIGLVAFNLVRGIRSTNHTQSASLKSDQSSRGFEVPPSDSSPGETE